jgi:inhibitor of cysteine peptidase
VSTFEIRGEANLSTIVLTEADDGREVDAGLNDLVVVSLPENPTTGYLWAVASETAGVLMLENSDFSAVAGAGVGGGGRRTFSFRAAAAGRATLELVCRRPWETDASAAARYRLVITAG